MEKVLRYLKEVVELEEVLIEVSASSYSVAVAVERQQVVLWQRHPSISQESRECLTSITCVRMISRAGRDRKSVV